MRTLTPSRLGRFWLLLALLLGGTAARADDRTFDLGSGPVVLSDVSAQVGLRFTSLRFSPSDNGWLVDIVLTNRSLVVIPTPLVLWVESYSGTTGPIGPDGTEGSNPPHAYYDYTAQAPDALLWPGDKTKARTLLLGYNSGAPTIVGRVYAKLSALPPGLTMVRTLNEAGQPLPGVQVTESSPLGTSVTTSDPTFGMVTVGRTNGPHTWRFNFPDYLPVWRQASLLPGEVSLTPSPRLTRRASGVSVPMAGGSVASSSVNLTVPAGAFAQNTTINLTPLAAQTLPALLPLGWSPLQAFWLESPTEPLVPLSAVATLWGPLYGSESAALVWWNSNSGSWQVLQTLAGPATAPNVSLPKSGAFAIVVPDNGVGAPPAAVVGQPLLAASLHVPAYDGLTATGSVSPSVSVASRIPERVTGQASVLVTSGVGALPSGLSLFSKFREDYALRAGSPHRTPSYENFVVAYQRPGDVLSNTLQVTFPMRPLLLFDSDALAQATVESDLLPPGDYGLRVLGPSGGLATFGGISLQAAAGVFSRREALYLRPLAADDLALLSHSNATAVAGFDLGITGIAAGSNLVLQVSGISSNSLFVLARVIFQEGWFGLDPVQRLASNGSGILSSLEPGSGERLPGITGAGQFVLMRVNSAQGLITGIAHNAAAQAIAGLPVRIEGQPWLTLSGAGGAFRLVAPAGDALVTVADPATGDTGQTTVNIIAPDTPVNANPNVVASGPRVVSVTPTNGATGVARVTPVIVQFSEPIDPATWATNSVQLYSTNNSLIAATLTLNLQHTVATLLPVAQLAANTLHTIRISSNITDTTGLKLEGANQFTFITENDALNRLVAQLTSYEPVNGMAAIVGSPGTADPESPVILVNETTGWTATILSKPDGSFSNSIPADVDDYLAAVLVNQNGTRNEIPVGRQIFRDGSVGLFKRGGIIEAQSDGGSVQVIVEPGAIPNKTRLLLQPLSESSLQQALGNTQPTEGHILGGVSLSESGDPLTAAADISFSIPPDKLGLPPGADPAEASFVLSVPLKVDGETVFEIIDTMSYENGRLVTHSPPYLGVLIQHLNSQIERMFIPGKAVAAISLSSPATSLLMVPIFLSTGKASTVIGGVEATEVDANGNLDPQSTRPVAGAFVRLTRNASLQLPGGLRSGELFALSAADGSFAFPVTVERFSADAVAIYATHPRFPGQTPFAVTSDLALRRADLFAFSLGFRILPDDPLAPNDETAPTISFAHTPRDPAPGTTADAGATVTVAARDDVGVHSINLSIVSSENLDPSLTKAVVLTPLDATWSSGDKPIASREYRLTSEHPAIVRLRASATDAEAHFGFADTTVVIAGNVIFPTPTSSDPGPTVVWSWPRDGSSGMPPGDPLIFRFSAPLTATAAETVSTWLQLSAGTITSADLSPDAKQINIHFYAPAGSSVAATVQSSLLGANNRAFDQDPVASGDQSFSINFKMAEAAAPVTLPKTSLGAGVVTIGKYALTLDSLGDDDGSLNVYDLTDTLSGRLEPPVTLPPYPRDLCLIPQYSYRLEINGTCFTGDLVAIVGGQVGPRSFQYLRILDVSNPESPLFVAGAPIGVGSSTITRVRWSPPYLTYLETTAGITSVGVVHLQKFIIGMNATEAEIAAFGEGSEGLDLNGDGDYCDVNETTPYPPSSPLEFFGKDLTVTVETAQAIRDFDVDSASGLLGLTLGGGPAYYGAPPSMEWKHPAYRTVFSGLQEIDPTKATIDFTTYSEPKRVAMLPAVATEENGLIQVRDLALVSVRQTDTGKHNLSVIDVTDPESPSSLALFDCSAYGIPQGIQRRSDRLVALATSTDVLLLDPTRLGINAMPSGEIPALVGIIKGLGGGGAFDAPPSGINVVSSGGKSHLIRSGAKVSLVTFPDESPINLTTLTAQSRAEQERILAGGVPTDTLPVDPVLSPASAATHFYVRVDALVPNVSSLQLVLECLDETGQAYTGDSGQPPAVLGTDATRLALGIKASDAIHTCPTSLIAYRLSAQPSDPMYSVYIAGPIVVAGTALTPSTVTALLNEMPRFIIRSCASLWVGLDPNGSSLGSSGATASSVAGGRLVPGSGAAASVAQ